MPAILLACFVLSGAASLGFEVVWSRMLSQVFGASSLAIATVLATFMGGLALGSFLGGRFADRHPRRGLWAYAICELGIAGWALLVPVALKFYPAANAWLWERFPDSPMVLALLRAGLAALVLLPPTTLMGATLPILSRHVIRTREELGLLGQRVSTLYAANTLGAVIGAGMTGFYLLPTIGQTATIYLAVGVDVVLAVAILATLTVRARRARGAASSVAGAPDALATVEVPGVVTTAPPERLAPAVRRAVLVTVAMTGGLSMALEVLWSRALAMVIGSSVYSFSLVLVIFLSGLAGGAAWIGRPAARTQRPLLALGGAILAVGATVVLAHRVMDDLPALFIDLLEGASLEVGSLMTLQAICAGLAVAPTAAAMGAVLPLALRAYAGDADAVGRDVGRAYAANTVGAILGSLGGGFVILPLLGVEPGVRLAGCALLVLGLVLVASARGGPPRLRGALGVVGVGLLIALVAAPKWNAGALTAGVFRMSVAKRYVRSGGVIPAADIVYYRDGVTTTVTVERYADKLALKNNGKVEASSVGDMPTQVLVGLLPVILHGGRDLKVAVVGYGSGITVGSIAESPWVARVDVIELEPAVLEAADLFFGPLNHHAHQNPKVRRFLGDGRNFLTAHPEKYDVIVSEPSNPWIAGVASLFTREFYAFAKEHLAEDGVFCQWAQLYELGPRNVKTIYATFLEAFPSAIAWTPADQSSDTVIVGGLRPLTLDVRTLEAAFADPATRAELERGGVTDPAELVAQVLLTPSEMPAFAAGGTINTDDNGHLEYYAPRDLLASATGTRMADTIFSWRWPYGRVGDVVTGLAPDGDLGWRLRIARALLGKGRRREADAWLTPLTFSASAEPVRLLARAVALRGADEPELALDAGGTRPPASPTWFDADAEPTAVTEAVSKVAQVDAHLAAHRVAEAMTLADDMPGPAEGEGGDPWRLRLGLIAYRDLRFDDAKRLLQPICLRRGAPCERDPVVLYYLGRVVFGLGEFEHGAAMLERFVARWPELVPP